MSKTPVTDALIVSQSFVDQTRMFHRDAYVSLLEHARSQERTLSEAAKALAEAQKLGDYWRDLYQKEGLAKIGDDYP